MDKWLYLAMTPFQVLNCMAMQENIGRNCESDLVISDQFQDAIDISRRIESTGLFRRVIVIRSSHQEKAVARIAKTFVATRSSKGFEDLLSSIDGDYSCFANATYNPITAAILGEFARRRIKVKRVLYDEGTGSYNGNAFRTLHYLGKLPKGIASTSGLNKGTRIIGYMLGGRSCQFYPDEIWLYHPNAIGYNPRCALRQISISAGFLENCRKAFYGDEFDDTSQRTWEGVRTIIFDVLRSNTRSTIGQLPIDLLLRSGCLDRRTTIVRSHPLSTIGNNNCYPEYSSGLWEFEWSSCRNSNPVLIGFGSTAQITPKLLYNDEPYIVLLYALCENLNQNDNEVCRSVGMLAKRLYSNEDKVLIPSTIDEAISVIGNLVCKDDDLE